MKKKIVEGLTTLLFGTSLLFYQCGSKKPFTKEEIVPVSTNISPVVMQSKQISSTNLENESNQKGYFNFPLEGGKIMIRIVDGEGWKNFRNALDLYALSKDKARLSDKEIYEFIRPFDKQKDDVFKIDECVKLRRRARELYDKSILGDLEKEIDERNLKEVEPGLPHY